MDSTKRPASRTQSATYMQPNKVSLQAAAAASPSNRLSSRPGSAASNASTSSTRPQASSAVGERLVSRPIAAARARRQIGGSPIAAAASVAGSSDRPRVESRMLRRYRSDEQTRSKSPVRATSTISQHHPQQQQQQQPSVPMRVFGASRSNNVAQPIGVSGRQQSEPAVARRLRTATGSHITAPIAPSPPTQPAGARTPSRSGSILGSRAPSSASTTPLKTLSSASNGNTGKLSRANTVTTNRASLRAPPSPKTAEYGSASASNAATAPGATSGQPGVQSRIPRFARGVATEASVESRRLLLEECQALREKLAFEQETNHMLLDSLKKTANECQKMSAEKEQLAAERDDAQASNAELSQQLRSKEEFIQRLEEKVEAMETLLDAQTIDRSTARTPPARGGSPTGVAPALATNGSGAGLSGTLDEDWHDHSRRIRERVGQMQSVYLLEHPESEIDDATRKDLEVVDRYMERGLRTKAELAPHSAVQQQADRGKSGTAVASVATGAAGGSHGSFSALHARAPQHRRVVDEERVNRRRSTMLFAGLIQPSSGGGSHGLLGDSPNSPHGRSANNEGEGAEGKCGRCLQLLDTLQLLESDNDYYREANAKLRENITDVVSKHNAIVRFFERERQKVREARAQALVEASRAAAHDRAAIEARQRAQLEARVDEGDLNLHFDQALHIASPTRAF
ncbi:hypothetical protein GGI07_003463 [Coemansia sp. Benny D115]|nr:hypothetical protein GGI07_003463 [Coemansia sp. Benny D115]